MRLRHLAAALCLLLPIGCSHAPAARVPVDIRPLLAAVDLPAWPGPDVGLSQVVSGQAGGQAYSARFEVELTASQVALVALGHTGIPLFQLRLSDGKLDIRQQLANAGQLRPEWVISDLALAYWPAAALADWLRRQGLILRDDATTRSVEDESGQEIVAIEYGGGDRLRSEIRFEHRRLGYRLDIRTLALRALN